MQDKQGKVVDRREMLRVKLKSLAAEARIIRHEERRTRGALRDELADHRRKVVRQAARNTHVAYALIRGRAIERIEPNAKTEPNWSEVKRMCAQYGPKGFELKKAA